MIAAIDEQELGALVTHQIGNLFFCRAAEAEAIRRALPIALSRSQRCFTEIANKYYMDDTGAAYFNPYHSGQYSIFLYYLSRVAYEHHEQTLADKLYYLNKALNCCDLFHQIELPEIFFVEHPIGSVMGRAEYGDYLVFQQNCTIGGNKGKYPVLGEFVWLYSGASVIGDSRIGNNVFISANALVKDEAVPDNTIVFGTSPDLTLRSMPPEYFYSRSPFAVHSGRLNT